jgi:membrane associated rhomboid family serine protease
MGHRGSFTLARQPGERGPRMIRARSIPARQALWATGALLMAIAVMGAITLAPQAMVSSEDMAWRWGDPLWPGLVLCWFTHAGWVHVGTNLAVLVLFAPALERYVGPWRMIVAIVAGNALGLLAHMASAGFHVPILGASAAIYAIVTYSLVAGWHCPFVFSRPRVWRLWPTAVFHTLLAVEGLRWGVQIAGGHAPTSAGIHLGGIAAGVLAAGLLHRRWPGGLASHRARGPGAVAPQVGSTTTSSRAPART